MASGTNKKQEAALKALRDKLNAATRRKHYGDAVEACQAIIAMDAASKSLNIMACLYHKDMGEAYLKLHEYELGLASLKTARDGLMEWRATKKLRFPEDWLVELKTLERLIQRVEANYFK
jgi:hypothetical protein